jgi:hypothetical protein
VGVSVGVAVMVGVAVGAAVAVLVAVAVTVGVTVAVGVEVVVAVSLAVAVDVAVTVAVGVAVGVSVGVAVLVAVAVGLGVPSAIPTSFTDPCRPLLLPPKVSFPVSLVPEGLRAIRGLKLTVMTQLSFGASIEPQVLAVNLNGPLIETGWMLTTVRFGFERVTALPGELVPA